jgi:hypothetical protein
MLGLNGEQRSVRFLAGLRRAIPKFRNEILPACRLSPPTCATREATGASLRNSLALPADPKCAASAIS